MTPNTIQKLAKSSKYQILFNRAKDINGINLFKNTFDFSYIQLVFLNWLNVYNSLYMDIASGEDFISEDVINDDIRMEAYLIYKHKIRNEKKQSNKGTSTKELTSRLPTIVFTSGKK